MEELIPITLFLCIAAVMILRPISTKLGALLEAMTRERLHAHTPGPGADPQLTRVTQLLEQIAHRQELLEERLDFTERLVDSSRRRLAPVGDQPLPRDDLRPAQEAAAGLRR